MRVYHINNDIGNVEYYFGQIKI